MYDIIGDIHGCYAELQNLLLKLGYYFKDNCYFHKNRIAVFLGDITDRGWYSIPTLLLIKNMVSNGNIIVRGNHDDKLLRYLKGRNVILNHGLDKTVKEIENNNLINRNELIDFLESIPLFKFINNNLVVVHGAWKDSFINKCPFSSKCRTWCLFMPNNGIDKKTGFPIRLNWQDERVVSNSSPIIVYGHQPYKEVLIKNKTYGIDTGCVFGGKLTALRYPEMELVSINSTRCYSEQPTMWGIHDEEDST